MESTSIRLSGKQICVKAPPTSRTISATELRRHLAEYLDRIASHGESFLIEQGERPVAELRPTPRGARGADFLARYPSLPHLAPEEADAMAQDLEEARRELAQTLASSPWEP